MKIAPGTVIPSVLRLRDLTLALEAGSPYVLLSNTHIGNLADMCSQVRDAGKETLVHADLIGGFKPDREGVRLLRNLYGVSGLLTQSFQTIAAAKAANLTAIYRLFLVDSRLYNRGLSLAAEHQPDAIELLPGPVAARVITEVSQQCPDATLIAGGFVTEAGEAQALFDAGFSAITTSTPTLWT